MLTRQGLLSVMTGRRPRPLPHPPSPGVLLISVCQRWSPRNKRDTTFVVSLMIITESTVPSLPNAMLATQPVMLLPVVHLKPPSRQQNMPVAYRAPLLYRKKVWQRVEQPAHLSVRGTKAKTNVKSPVSGRAMNNDIDNSYMGRKPNSAVIAQEL